LKDVWAKAGVILQDPSAVASFPTKKDAAVVFCGQEAFTVVKNKGPTCLFKCETRSCKSWGFFDKLLCEHTLATAEHFELLPEYITCINESKRATSVNLINELLNDACAGTGEKKRANKRKGKNNSLGSEVTDVVPLPPLLASDDLSTRSVEPHTADTRKVPATKQPFSIHLKVGIIKRCYGCGILFKPIQDTPPNDIILKRLDYREWYDKQTGETKVTNTMVGTYYHLRMDCIRRREPTVQTKDIIMHDEIYEQLTPCHLQKLQMFGIRF
jgi:hypothetical protein